MAVHWILDEVEVALDLISRKRSNQSITAEDWERLFATRGYCLLKERELSYKLEFTDEQFQSYLISEETIAQYDELHAALTQAQGIHIEDLARKALVYLPKGATIDTEVFPMIKPKKNSFVYQTDEGIKIFMYLEPNVTTEYLENLLAHELHHIGYSTISSDEVYADLPKNVQDMLEWSSAFAEGFAMLAAAGGPEIHPNKYNAYLKEFWDRNITNVNEDFTKLEEFFLKILAGDFASEAEITKRGMEFINGNGGQGAFYTVGYMISVVIETIMGRDALLDSMSDMRKLLTYYNQSVEEYNAKFHNNLKPWSESLISQIS